VSLPALVALLVASWVQAVLPSPDDLAAGAALVCAEARGGTSGERRAIAGVVRNRARRLRRRVRAVVEAHRQFAPLCPRAAVTARHRLDFMAGWLGLGMPEWWSADVWAFQTHASAARGGSRRWRDVYGWRRVDGGGLLHTYWEGSP